MLAQLHRISQRINLKASANYNTVSVAIPLDFEGAVTAINSYGKIKFSKAIEARLIHYSKARGTAKSLIAPLLPSGSDGVDDKPASSTWDGDEIVLRSGDGPVELSFVDEPPEPPEAAGLTKDVSKAGHSDGPVRYLKRKLWGDESLGSTSQKS